MAMKWYAAKLLTYSRIGREVQKKALTDEGIFLIRAKDASDAYEKAKRLGKKVCPQQYKNPSGQKVMWRFIGVMELWELWDSPPKSGSEVWWDLRERNSDLKHLRSLIPPRLELKAFR